MSKKRDLKSRIELLEKVNEEYLQNIERYRLENVNLRDQIKNESDLVSKYAYDVIASKAEMSTSSLENVQLKRVIHLIQAACTQAQGDAPLWIQFFSTNDEGGASIGPVVCGPYAKIEASCESILISRANEEDLFDLAVYSSCDNTWLLNDGRSFTNWHISTEAP